MRLRGVLISLAAAAALVLLTPGRGIGDEPILQRQVDSIPVVEDGQPIPQPWTGGLDSPRPQLADLDADQDLDLLIAHGGGGISHYRNDGVAGSHLFRFVTDQLQNIDAGTWATLADIDADGDLDLFTDGVGSVALHRNDGSAAQPLWRLTDPTFQGIVNSGSGNTPSFVDVDGDGDLDYLEMEQNFGTARMYRNTGTRQNPHYDFVTNTWGCIDTFDPGFAGERGASRHGISVIATADIDRDDDVDIFIGDLLNANLWYFRNDPAPEVCYTKVTKEYMPVGTLGLNHAVLGDLDHDSDLDLLVGVASQGASTDNLIYLENRGTPHEPQHVVTTMNLIRALDVGSGSRPAAGDLDGDGDLDLYVGSSDGTIQELVNAGTRTGPSYEVRGALRDWADLDIDVGFWSAPELIDYEGDGDLDLLAGSGIGRVHFYRNDGSAGAPALRLVDAQFAGVRGDFNAVPALGDLDGDGDLDLLVGEFGSTLNPRLFYMRNDGTTESPLWVQVSNNTSSTSIFAERVFQGNLAPELFDLDGDHDLDLFLGETDGNVNFYRNDGTPASFQFVLVSQGFGGVEIGLNSGPCFADLDGDVDADLLVGERNGGVNLFRNLTLSPVTLLGFTAADRGGWVELRWETGEESDLLGFRVHRADDLAGRPGPFVPLTDRPVTGSSPYRFEDRSVIRGRSYFYRLEDVDRRGLGTMHPPVPVSVARLAAAAPVLRAVAPLPAGSSTTLFFSLSRAGRVELRLHDAGGRLVRRLLDRRLAAGEQAVAWDGRDDGGRRVPSGVYFADLRTPAGGATVKIVAMR